MGGAIMVVFVVISSMFSLHCNAQNFTSCVKAVALPATSNPQQTPPIIAECCGFLNNTKNNAPQLLCDAVINATNAPSFEKARSSFDQLAGKCDAAVQKKLVFGSTNCTQLPLTSIANDCFSFVADLSSTPTNSSIKTCCNAIQKQFTGNNGISNEQVIAAICNSLETVLSRAMIRRTANEGFRAIATKCLSHLSIDVKSTKCPLPNLPPRTLTRPQ